jgi:hypothetical protein
VWLCAGLGQNLAGQKLDWTAYIRQLAAAKALSVYTYLSSTCRIREPATRQRTIHFR